MAPWNCPVCGVRISAVQEMCDACHEARHPNAKLLLVLAKAQEETTRLQRVLEECPGKACDWCGAHFVLDTDAVSEVNNAPGLIHWICDPCLSTTDREFARCRHSARRMPERTRATP